MADTDADNETAPAIAGKDTMLNALLTGILSAGLICGHAFAEDRYSQGPTTSTPIVAQSAFPVPPEVTALRLRGLRPPTTCLANSVDISPGGGWLLVGQSIQSGPNTLDSLLSKGRDWVVPVDGFSEGAVPFTVSTISYYRRFHTSTTGVYIDLLSGMSLESFAHQDGRWRTGLAVPDLQGANLNADRVSVSISLIPDLVSRRWSPAAEPTPVDPTVINEGLKRIAALILGVGDSGAASYVLGGERDEALSLIRLNAPAGNVARVDPRIDEVGFRDLRLGYGPDGSALLVATGLVARLQEGVFRPFATPLYARAPKVAGDDWVRWLFNPTTVTPLPGTTETEVAIAASLQERAEPWLAHGWIIADMAVDPRTGATAALFKGAGQFDRALVVWSADGPMRWEACNGDGLSRSGKARRLPPDDLPRPSLPVRVSPGPDTDWRLGFWSVRPTGPAKGTVVRLRGGPAANLLKETTGPMTPAFASRGLAVVAVDYSGTTGSAIDVFTRLRLDLNGSLSRDARTIIKFLEDGGYPRPYHILAESFGTMLASRLVASSPDLFSSINLMVPLIRLRGQDELGWETEDDTVSYVNWYQDLSSGLGTPSSRDRFNAAAIEAMQVFCDRAGVRLFFGALDPAIRPEDWAIGCLARIERRTFADAAHHTSVAMTQAILDNIDAHAQRASPSQSR